MPLSVNYRNILCRSLSNLIMTASIDASNAKIVVSSEKLHISDSISIRKRSLTKMLKSKGKRTDPFGIVIEIWFAELYVDPILTRRILFVKKL